MPPAGIQAAAAQQTCQARTAPCSRCRPARHERARRLRWQAGSCPPPLCLSAGYQTSGCWAYARPPEGEPRASRTGRSRRCSICGMRRSSAWPHAAPAAATLRLPTPPRPCCPAGLQLGPARRDGLHHHRAGRPLQGVAAGLRHAAAAAPRRGRPGMPGTRCQLPCIPMRVPCECGSNSI